MLLFKDLFDRWKVICLIKEVRAVGAAFNGRNEVSNWGPGAGNLVRTRSLNWTPSRAISRGLRGFVALKLAGHPLHLLPLGFRPRQSTRLCGHGLRHGLIEHSRLDVWSWALKLLHNLLHKAWQHISKGCLNTRRRGVFSGPLNVPAGTSSTSCAAARPCRRQAGLTSGRQRHCLVIRHTTCALHLKRCTATRDRPRVSNPAIRVKMIKRFLQQPKWVKLGH
jgi:hypothetical protein